jgi:HEAT repeat protein
MDEFEILVSELKDKDRNTRFNAAPALGDLDDIIAFDPLVEALKDRNGAARAGAASGLGELGDRRAVSSPDMGTCRVMR